MTDSTIPPRDRVAALSAPRDARLFAGGLALVVGSFLLAMAVRTRDQEAALFVDPDVQRIVLAATLVTLVGGALAVASLPRLTAPWGIEGLTLIGLLSALHFLAAAGSRLLGTVLTGIFGPYAIFASGIGDEGIPSMIAAALVVLLPRVGALGLSLATVFLLMVVTSGSLGLSSLIFIVPSILAHEGALALAGLTTGSRLAVPARYPPVDLVLRMALAIGAANALALYVQYAAYRAWFRLQMPDWYVVSLVVVSGLIYGAAGGALGTILGYRWRRIAP